MKQIALVEEYLEKEVLFCKELHTEVRILCLKEAAITDKEKQLEKSGIKMSEKDAIFAIKIRIKNLIESKL